MLLDAVGAVPDSIARQVDAYLVAVGDVEVEAMRTAEIIRSSCKSCDYRITAVVAASRIR